MNILITGASGLIGSHLTEYLKQSGSILSPSSKELNISSNESVDSYFKTRSPEIVIHSAAYTDVTGGEQQRNDKNGLAWKINVDGTQNIISASKNNGARLIHISTDVVFSGKTDDKGPYKENHPLETHSDRLSWYGWSKAEAEKLIFNQLTNYSIVRISNPTRAKYDRKLDYVRKITAAFDQKKPIRLFSDQYLTLTFVNEVSTAIKKIIDDNHIGIFHVSSANLFTPFELAEYTLEKARGAKNIVEKSSIEEFLKQPGNNSRYPQYGGLNVQETQAKLEIQFKTWQEIINNLIQEGI